MHLVDRGVPVLGAPGRIGVHGDGVDFADALAPVVGDESQEGGAVGRLETGKTVQWEFADFPGAFPVEVVEVEPNRRIVLRWEANEGPPEAEEAVVRAAYMTTVVFTFEPLDDGRTLVTIEEGGWHETPTGLKAAFGNCQGWSQMLAALKAWVEHGVNLREGFYV